MNRTYAFKIAIILMSLIFSPQILHAACSTPTANIGSLDFQSGSFKYCDGTNWLPLGGGGALSGITAATATNTIDSLNFAQAWSWSTAGVQTPMTITADALTTGSILKLETSSATVGSTSGLLYVANTGASTTGKIARIQSNSTADSGLTVLADGNVGVGANPSGTRFKAYSTSAIEVANIEDATSDGVGGRPTLILKRTRADATALSSAQGPVIEFNMEGFSNFSVVQTGRITNAWEVPQANDTTDRDSSMAFSTTLNGAMGERVRITSAGNVGIGASAPSSILDINGAETMRGMAAPAVSPASQGRIYFDSTANKYKVSQNGGAYADLVSAGGGALSAITAATATNTIDNLNFAQTWNWSTATTQNGLMGLQANALTTGTLLSVGTTNASANSTNGLLWVGNTSAGTSGTIARIQSSSAAGSGLTVLANGSVGIGTTAPGNLLEVNKSVNATAQMSMVNTNTGSSAMSFVAATSDAGSINLGITSVAGGGISVLSTAAAGGLKIQNYGTGDIIFSTSAGYTERMRISTAGNVGIGLTPGANTKLDVNGQIRSPSSTTASNALDFVTGNSISTSTTCASAITLANIRDGGAYTIAVTSTATTQCTFSTTTTGDDAATVTYRFSPANGPRTASTHTLYSLQRIGTIVYVSWITGF